MNDFNKIQHILKHDMLVLMLIVLILSIFEFPNLFLLGLVVCFIIGYVLAQKGLKVAGIFGIVVGSLMLLTIIKGDLIQALLGLFLLLHSIKYTKIYEDD